MQIFTKKCIKERESLAKIFQDKVYRVFHVLLIS